MGANLAADIMLVFVIVMAITGYVHFRVQDKKESKTQL